MLSGAISNFSMEKRYIRKDGLPIWVNLTVGCVRKANGSVDYFISVVEDITKRKEAEDRLKDSEDRLRRILNNLFAFVGVLTPEGVLAEVNDAPMKLASLSRHEVIGKRFWDCYWWNFSKRSRERLKRAFGRALKGQTVRYDVEIRVADGQFITVDFQLAPLKNALGEMVEVIRSGTDITDRRRVEAKPTRKRGRSAVGAGCGEPWPVELGLGTQDLIWADRCKAFSAFRQTQR